MFDFSFYELLVFGIIALIVLGPEKLPQTVRTLGTYYAKFRRTVGTIKAEMEAELDLAETRQLMQEELARIRQTEAKMKQEMNQLRDSMQEFEQQQNTQLQHTLRADGSTDTPSDVPHNALTQSMNQNAGSPNMVTESGANSSNAVHSNAVNDNTANESTANDNPVNESAGSKKPTTKAKRPDHDDWVHPVAGASPVTTVASADPNTPQSNANITNTSHTDNEGWRLPMNRPWENMWFLLGDYDRVRRLPPAPFLPNYKANPLLNAIANHSTVANSTTQNGMAHRTTVATASRSEANP